MTNNRETIAKIAVLLGLLALLAGCGGGRGGDDEASGTTTESSGGGGDLSGRIEADGSSTVGPYTTAAAEKFQGQEPGVQVTVGVSGTGGGFERFCRGETDLSNASRPIKDEEATICEDAGIEPVEFQVANDALTVVVNKDNDWVDCLTTEQLKKIWEPGSKVTSWKDVDPSFPDEELKLFGPGTDSGTFDYFTDEINGEEARAAPTTRRARTTTRSSPASPARRGPRLLRLLLLRGEPGHAEGARDRRRRRLRRAERRGGAGRHLQAAFPPALHLREEGGAGAAGGRGLPPLPARERAVDRGGVAVRAVDRRAADQGQRRPRRGDRGVVGGDRPDGEARSRGSAPSAAGSGRTSSRASSSSAR